MGSISNDHSSTRHKPGLEGLLRVLGLDIVYYGGEGDLLYHRRPDGQQVEVVDLVGGYGALLLGHHHPEIVATMMAFLAKPRANHVQGSIRPGARQLADALNARCEGDYCTVLANSGTEAVEAAFKHALLETQGRTFIALDGAFHGKTLGSLLATSNSRFREPFCKIPVNVVHVRPGDLRQLKHTFDHIHDLAGFIFEPIQGEAGVRPLTAEFIQTAAQLCADRKIPLIADECQTGLGRTGSFLASQSYGISPDYIILSKALGGGLAKISALLIDRQRYCQEFDFVHSSTFADDELSCQVALQVLDLIDEDALATCRRQGKDLLEQLRSLQQQYPNVIADVRGRGLMLGFQLHCPGPNSSFILKHLADRQLLGPLVASFLLNQHQIRVASTLSDPTTLRLQPSLLIGRDRLNQFVKALKDVCEKLDSHDIVGLTRFLAKPTSQIEPVPFPASDTPSIYYFPRTETSQVADSRCTHQSPVRRVAWVFHLVNSYDLAHMDPALAAFTQEEKDAFCERWSLLCEPVVMPSVDIHSSANEVVRLQPILLPVTSQWMLRRMYGTHAKHARQLVQKAVNVAAALGCDVVSLGQFTSIVSRRGKCLDNHAMQITAGSNYSAVLISQAIANELNRRSWNPRKLTLGVVGAAGDIGSTCTAIMGPAYRQCILVGSGRAASHSRLARMASEMEGARFSTSLHALDEADVVVCATNSITAPLGPEFLKPDAIVCDASVPATLQPHIGDGLNNVTILPGAIAALPGKEALKIPGFPLPPGFTYGCMAEGLLLGLNTAETADWSGRSNCERARRISQVAALHGFTVANCSPTRELCGAPL